MTYIKINETLYPATIEGKMGDISWDRRESKTITLEMDYSTALGLFVDGLVWSIVCENKITDEGTLETVVSTEEFDNSDYCIAGTITDNRDGTLSVKMGKPTETEILQAQLANAVTEEELSNAYNEGVNSL